MQIDGKSSTNFQYVDCDGSRGGCVPLLSPAPIANDGLAGRRATKTHALIGQERNRQTYPELRLSERDNSFQRRAIGLIASGSSGFEHGITTYDLYSSTRPQLLAITSHFQSALQWPPHHQHPWDPPILRPYLEGLPPGRRTSQQGPSYIAQILCLVKPTRELTRSTIAPTMKSLSR